MNIEVKNNWRLWCRLCTKDNARNITNMLLKTEERTNEMEIDYSEKLDENKYTNKEDLVAAIEKYFAVNLRDNEELPKSLCAECFSFVKNLMVFRDRVAKAQHFFHNLQQTTNEDNDYDANGLRLKYGLSNQDAALSVQQQQPEVHYFDTKSETNEVQEENIFEPEIIITDPLEVPKIRLRIKAEKMEADKLEGIAVSAVEKTTSTANDNEIMTNQTPQKNKRETVENTGVRIKLGIKRKRTKSAKEMKSSKCTSNDTNQTSQETAYKKQKPVKHSSQNEGLEDIVKCEECAIKFKTITNFKKHMSEVHNKDVPKYYTCPQCARKFQQPNNLRKHLLVHKPIESRRVVPCPHCDKKFTSSSMMESHINYIHKNVRPFICEKCGETWRTNTDLRSHILTHSDYAPFQCEVCKKRFKHKTRLRRHMYIHDTHKPICIECGMQFSTPSTLKRHMLVHSSEMQHKCDHCGRAFKRSKTLKSHLLLHTGLKPYTCNFCDRTFASGANCRTHKKRAHPEELAALEATGSTKTNKLNIPKLKTLKALTKTSEIFVPVVSKQKRLF